MIPFNISIQRSETVGARLHGQASAHALNMVARRHLFHNLGLRFRAGPETTPGGPLGFAKRNENYEARKKRKKGHTRPLVFSGHLMRFARNNSQITKTQDRSVIRLKAPHVLLSQQWRELTATAESEEREYQQLAAVEYSEFLKKNKSPRTRRKIT